MERHRIGVDLARGVCPGIWAFMTLTAGELEMPPTQHKGMGVRAR